ncbi:MAG: Succinyl-CoA--L-malate CoA-transferase beta subunit [Acidimicrobiales bacterium]|nr:MAG: CoA transferase [Actinomycetota bacterium]MBV6510403.1 Succinyl-CoA--L-malate CoA-transferase beta subunit [Acidimicrobiales bacterium]RIK02601.1 MAG: CoA transferase [Acidobacteriota bacterium]
MSASQPPLASVRVIESALLGPGAITTHLADLGAEVIKVEPPRGDYIRQMTWPIIEGNSLMHLHLHRGKRSITLDLKKPEAIDVYKDLVRGADVVVEAMRPGALARLGLGYDDLKELNPAIVFCTISGYGMTGPYRDMPSHGIAYDTWAGLVNPAYDEEGYCYIPEHPSVGIHAGPLFGAFGILAGVVRARQTGEGCVMEIAQSDAAAYMDWYRSETWKAYERPADEVTGNAADDYERRAPGTAGMKEGVRYQMYESADGHVLFMASEQEFWRNFCAGVGRLDLFERWPGSRFADHARHNRELQAELREIFKTRTSAEWIEFSNEHNTPIAPVNTPRTIAEDPQFQDRFPWYGHQSHGADMLPFPVKFIGEELPDPAHAPTVGQHTDEVLTTVLGYDAGRVEELRESGALG